MNKNAIKNFAINARRELISRVSQKALQYGISEKEIGNPSDDTVGGHLLSSVEKKQRAALIEQIKEKDYKQVMEEVAYTWFNRFSALRFMEVNGYLPTRVRVFTDENNQFKPQILAEAIHMEIEGLDMEKVYAYKEANDNDELYKYLLITQCNALNSMLPGMFQKLSDYTELLFPDNLLREDSVIQQMIELIPEEDWKDTVQIIGWLYQYYNSEKKDDVFAALKKNVKITKENIPAATQLFTPDWIVRYMVENSLGRLWVEGHPNDDLKSQWKYYLEEAEQEPDVQAQLGTIREEYKALKPEDILCIDPCSGSGHILAYMFDVLVQIYEAYGVDTRTAVASIVENNIYGLDIDDRAAQLAYFSVMMKACQYDRRFLRRNVQPHVYAIVESNHVDPYVVDYFCNGDAKLKAAMDTIIKELHDAKEYGSIITVTPQDWAALYARFDEIKSEDVISIYSERALELKKMVNVAEILDKKYFAVVTNPPYMGANNMGDKLTKFLKSNYPKTKSDMSTVFMEKTLTFCKKGGYMSMINIPVWMFLSTYESMRNTIIANNTITTMLHFGRGVFGSDFGTTAFTIINDSIQNYSGSYRRLFEKQGAVDSVEMKEKWFLEGMGKYTSTQNRFSNVPGNPIAYWMSDKVEEDFQKGSSLSQIADIKQGLKTGDNDKFLRLWFEVQSNKFSVFEGTKWYPCNKGGDYRRWYGNNNYVINWENDGYELKNFRHPDGRQKSRPQNLQYQFKEGLTYTNISSSKFGVRYCPNGFAFDAAGSMIFTSEDKLLYLLGLLSSNVILAFTSILSPTMSFEVGQISSIPFIWEENKKVNELVSECISMSIEDWDSFETSWDFKKHPLIRNVSTIKEAFSLWSRECQKRLDTIRNNEEELNKIFIDVYGLEKEISPAVDESEITLKRADLKRDIRSFISYAVGCMFGRYSLDKEGLVFAGGEWEASNYITYVADTDNIIPISDDEYFEDDIVSRFVKFVEIVYGEDTLQENLKFIADALGGKGQPKDVIRNYFINDFYSDHCGRYYLTKAGKRPIYWLFSSGKKNGFKCLVYMHRYQPDTIARIRTDYVHEQQARYRTAIVDLENRIAGASASERVKLNKQLKTLNEQAIEIHEYEEKIHHLADQMISINLDDGVKKNYEIFKDVLAKIK